MNNISFVGLKRVKLINYYFDAVSGFGNLSDAVQSNDKVFKVLRSMFPIKHVSLKPSINNSSNSKQKLGLPLTDKFSRTDLLLSAWQLVEEGYPLPLRGELSTRLDL